MGDRIDFIEGQPVLDLVLVTLENSANVMLKEIDHFTIAPAIIGPC